MYGASSRAFYVMPRIADDPASKLATSHLLYLAALPATYASASPRSRSPFAPTTVHLRAHQYVLPDLRWCTTDTAPLSSTSPLSTSPYTM